MKQKLLSLAAILSILMIAVMSLAYVGAFETGLRFYQRGTAPVLRVDVMLEDRRFRVLLDATMITTGTVQFLQIGETHAAFFPTSFHAGHWFSDFDLHLISTTELLVSVPTWFPILLGCVAPAFWVYRRTHAKAIGRGFAVEIDPVQFAPTPALRRKTRRGGSSA